MASSSIFDVVDYLVSGFGALPAVPQVLDGAPGTIVPTRFVSVGGSVDPTSDSVESWPILNTATVEEDYSVRCYVSSFVGGDTAADVKQARDNAKVMFDACYTFLRSDVTFGGLVTVAARVSGVSMSQTPDQDAVSGVATGRRCNLAFSVHVVTRI